MILVGSVKRREWADFRERSRWFEEKASSAERKDLLDAHRKACTAEIEKAVRLEMDPADPPEVRELENKLRDTFATLLIRPQPTGAKLRYNHEPIIKRSRAYPAIPAAASTLSHDTSQLSA